MRLVQYQRGCVAGFPNACVLTQPFQGCSPFVRITQGSSRTCNPGLCCGIPLGFTQYGHSAVHCLPPSGGACAGWFAELPLLAGALEALRSDVPARFRRQTVWDAIVGSEREESSSVAAWLQAP